MDIAITKMSSKGQVVIPAEMRENLHEGDKILIIQTDNQLVMKKANQLDEQLKEDLEFARRTEEAWEQIEKGKYTTYTKEEFLKKLKTL